MNSITLIKPVGNSTAAFTGTYTAQNKNLTFSESIKTDSEAIYEHDFSYLAKSSADNNVWQLGNTGNYKQPAGGNGTTTDYLTGSYKYYKDEGKWKRKTIIKNGIYSGPHYDNDIEVLNTYLSSITPYDDDEGQEETYYNYDSWHEQTLDDGTDLYVGYVYYTEYEWQLEWESKNNKKYTESMTVYFYPRPKEFTFDNCTPGNKWRVDKGINARAEDGGLIHNLTDFQSYANQWQAWKTQRSYTSTPSFDSPLSASCINSIYESLGKSGGYSSGDPVKAEMFNNLAGIIN